MRLQCSSGTFLKRKKVYTKKYQKIFELLVTLTNRNSTALRIVAILINRASQNIE